MPGVSDSRRPAKHVVLAVLVLATVVVGGVTVNLLSDRTTSTGIGAGEPIPTGWSGVDSERVALIRELAVPVLACVGRVDVRAAHSAMFHGWGDWHNALAGHYPLYTAYLRTRGGD